MTDYTGPERRVGPPSRRDGDGGRYSDRRYHWNRDAGWLERCLFCGYFGWNRRKNEGRRSTPETGLRRVADRDRYDAHCKASLALVEWLERPRP